MNIFWIIVVALFVIKIGDACCFFYLQSKGDIPKDANYWDGE